MGASKHEQGLLYLTFIITIYLDPVNLQVYKVSKKKSICSIIIINYPENLGITIWKRNWHETCKHLKKLKGISHVFQEGWEGHTEVQGGWRTVAGSSSGYAVHLDGHWLGIKRAVCPGPALRLKYSYSPRCWECWPMMLIAKSLHRHCPWHKGVALASIKPRP